MNDWKWVIESEPWLVPSPGEATVRPAQTEFRPSREFQSTFPRMTELLSRARRSEITLPGGSHVLFAWGDTEHEIRAWLSPAVPPVVPEAAAPDHRNLLGC